MEAANAEIDITNNFVQQQKKKIDALEDFYSKYTQISNAAKELMGALFEAELTEEVNKTNKVKEELNSRLLNENLSKDERARIQQEIWRNDEESRKRQNKIKKNNLIRKRLLTYHKL